MTFSQSNEIKDEGTFSKKNKFKKLSDGKKSSSGKSKAKQLLKSSTESPIDMSIDSSTVSLKSKKLRNKTPDPPSPTEPSPVNWREKLRSDLMTGYSKDVHPVKNHMSSVKVDVGMALIHLDMDEMKSVLEVDCWMRLNWTDEYLVWDPAKYQNLTQIHFGSDEIWRPDIQLYNSADGSHVENYGATHYLVFHTGVVLWVPPAKFRSFCKIDLRIWPHDLQSCKLKFGSWTSHGNQIDLGLFHNMSSVEQLNFYTANKEWQILTATATRNTNKYESVPETYPDVTFTFYLQRLSPSYKATIILPCMITMLLVVSSFLLPPSAGEKLTINAVSFTVCVLYMIYFQMTLPNMSDHIPLIVLFYSNTGALVGIAMVLNVACISLSRERRYSGPPKWMKHFFSGYMGRVLCLSSYSSQVSETHQRLMVELDDISESPESEQTGIDLNSHETVGSLVMRDWVLVAAGIERFFFLIYTIAFAFVTSTFL